MALSDKEQDFPEKVKDWPNGKKPEDARY